MTDTSTLTQILRIQHPDTSKQYWTDITPFINAHASLTIQHWHWYWQHWELLCQHINHSLIIRREGLILTLWILPCPQGRISWSTSCGKIYDEGMSVLQELGNPSPPPSRFPSALLGLGRAVFAFICHPNMRYLLWLNFGVLRMGIQYCPRAILQFCPILFSHLSCWIPGLQGNLENQNASLCNLFHRKGEFSFKNLVAFSICPHLALIHFVSEKNLQILVIAAFVIYCGIAAMCQ